MKGKPFILVAHDDSTKRYSLKAAFEDDFLVLAAAGAREAIEIIGQQPRVDALVVDRYLPSPDAATLLRFVQEMVHRPEAVTKLLLNENGDGRPAPPPPPAGWVDAIIDGPFDAARIRRRVRKLMARKSREKRGIMRAAFDTRAGIEADIGAQGRAPVENLSESGMFVRAILPPNYILPVSLYLPDGRCLLATGRVVRVDEAGVGVQFLLVEDEARASIVRLIAESNIENDLDELRDKYPFLRRDNIVAFADKIRIKDLLDEALRTEAEFTVIQTGDRQPASVRLTSLESRRFCRLAGQDLGSRFKTSDAIFVSFQFGPATYTFESLVYRIDPDGKSLECLYPRILFYSEKRSSRRALSDQALAVEITLPEPFAKTIRGSVTDIGEGGVSFLSADRDIALLIGTPLDAIRIIQDGKLVREVRGEIRNVLKIGDEGGTKFRYGVQFGIGRMPILTAELARPETHEEQPPARDSEKLRSGPRRHSDLSELAKRPPHVIRLENSKGEEIVALLNTSLPLDGDPVPVVIVPPAFGKTKETLFALAQTIVENFYLRGKPIAVLRFDGIRRKGESHKDPDSSEPPFEMLHASFTQGADDIRSVLDWLDFNPTLKASSVILISFSLSALEARILLRDETYRRKIGYWISCMGTPEFRDLMIRVNCGLDFLEQHQIGLRLGVMPVLGNLVDVDPYVADGVQNRVATLEQARADMPLLDLPITWIYGEHDHWVKAEFVRDIMSIRSESLREVLAVPLGHNARTSEEALSLFGTVTALIYRFLYKDLILPVAPDKNGIVLLRRAEKDRIPARPIKNRRDYWQRYLVGEENLLGFDVLTLSDDYRNLMRDQALALDLRPDDRVLDLGGGTGNFVEQIIEAGQSLPSRLIVADLIPAAMRQARTKLSALTPAPAGLDRLDFLGLDVELNRYLPIHRFLSGEIGRFRTLSERIENLPLQSADRIDEAFSPRLHRVLRGETITPATDQWLKSCFDLDEYRIILDFNLAVRFVRGRTAEKPVFRKLGFGGKTEQALHLPFRDASFTKILMSLVLSYIYNPVETLREIRRIIVPGGWLVLSSMRPDADASGLFTRLVAKLETIPSRDFSPDRPKAFLLDSIRTFLNNAQALVELEEAGTFDFFDSVRLDGLLDEAGWEPLDHRPSFGTPPQGYIITARPREIHES